MKLSTTSYAGQADFRGILFSAWLCVVECLVIHFIHQQELLNAYNVLLRLPGFLPSYVWVKRSIFWALKSFDLSIFHLRITLGLFSRQCGANIAVTQASAYRIVFKSWNQCRSIRDLLGQGAQRKCSLCFAAMISNSAEFSVASRGQS